eukprot:jgi/Mesvir1/28172/Mv04732-RA.1
MATVAVGFILDKIASKDKDLRYMATSDLLNELQKDSFHADPETERKIVHVVLQQMEDMAGDISGLAVKCLAPLVKKASEQKVLEIVEALCSKLLTGKEQQRDIASMGLKAVLLEISAAVDSRVVVKAITPRVIGGISDPSASQEVKGECLDILTAMLTRFGHLMVDNHPNLRDCLLSQLDSDKHILRKRTITCLSALAPASSDTLLLSTVERIVERMHDKGKRLLTRTYVQCLTALCRSVGFRLGQKLGGAVPRLMEYCRTANTPDNETDDELRENALQALESIILRCRQEVDNHTSAILSLCLEYLKYDPNFIYSDDMEEESDDDDMASEDDGEYSDDEDVSWKVRRGAAKCLSALITSRPEMLHDMYDKALPELIARFREREENVKLDVFQTFIDLLRQTADVTRAAGGDAKQASPTAYLQKALPQVVKSLQRQLKEKSLRTKVGAFQVTRELASALPHHSMAAHLDVIIPCVVDALTDSASSSNLKIEALQLMRVLLSGHEPEAFHPHIKSLSGPVMAAVEDRYYKVTAEALRVCGQLIKAIRPNVKAPSSFDFKPFVPPLYECIFKRLNAQDQDQEVKDCAIACAATLVSTMGDCFAVQGCLSTVLERTRNEITRLTAVKAFGTIADSELQIDLSAITTGALEELTSFLRKASRPLRQASLSALDSLVRSPSCVGISDGSCDALIPEVAALISDADLHVASLGLRLCCTLLEKRPSSAPAINGKVLPQALGMLGSPLLQGHALEMLQALLVALGIPQGGYESLLNALLSTRADTKSASQVGHRQAYLAIAQCVCSLCLAAGDAQFQSTVARLMATVAEPKAEDSSLPQRQELILALFSLGEIGHHKDLSGHAGLESLVAQRFTSSHEEVKGAAAYALGNMAAGCMTKYLPFLMDAALASAPAQQYMLLQTLREFIARHTARGSPLPDEYVARLLSLFFSHCESPEEGVRNVVAECLGKLVLLASATVLPALQAKRRDAGASAATRATVVMSLKYTLFEGQRDINAQLAPYLEDFLLLINDEDRHVRKAAVQTLSGAAHNEPSLLYRQLATLLPLLYQQTLVNKDLIRTVDLGPFKHTVDDGLELRKVSFECMGTLLDNAFNYMDPGPFTTHLLSGLSDHYDVKMPCHLILARLAAKCGPAVLAVLDALVPPLEKTVTAKTKDDAVKQEVDRNDDMIRSALRAVDALTRVSGVENNGAFTSFMSRTINAPPLAAKYSQVRSESDSSAAAATLATR